MSLKMVLYSLLKSHIHVLNIEKHINISYIGTEKKHLQYIRKNNGV